LWLLALVLAMWVLSPRAVYDAASRLPLEAHADRCVHSAEVGGARPLLRVGDTILWGRVQYVADAASPPIRAMNRSWPSRVCVRGTPWSNAGGEEASLVFVNEDAVCVQMFGQA